MHLNWKLRSPSQHSQALLRRLTPIAAVQAGKTNIPLAQNLSALIPWAIKEGIKFSGVRPQTIQGVRGVYATFPIVEGEKLVSVPAGSSLIAKPDDTCPFQTHLDNTQWSQLTWYVKLALKLLWEKRMGLESRLSPYLRVLPVSVELPAVWSDEELGELQYDYLAQQAKAEQEEWRSTYQVLRSGLLSSWAFTYEEFAWALTIVRSRSFAGPYALTSGTDKLRIALAAQGAVLFQMLYHPVHLGLKEVIVLGLLAASAALEARQSGNKQQYAICPVIDMFNHSSAAQHECEFNTFQGAYQIVASKRYAPGEQVCINYGAASNDRLLQLYGFVEQDNPSDRYVICDLLPKIAYACGDVSLAGAVVRTALATRDLTSNVRQVPVSSAGFPPETLQVLRWIMEGGARNGKDPAAYMQPRSDAGEARLLKALQQVIEQELAAAATTLEEDLQLLEAHQRPDPPPQHSTGAEDSGTPPEPLTSGDPAGAADSLFSADAAMSDSLYSASASVTEWMLSSGSSTSNDSLDVPGPGNGSVPHAAAASSEQPATAEHAGTSQEPQGRDLGDGHSTAQGPELGVGHSTAQGQELGVGHSTALDSSEGDGVGEARLRLSPRQLVALQFRIGKKRILRSCGDALGAAQQRLLAVAAPRR